MHMANEAEKPEKRDMTIVIIFLSYWFSLFLHVYIVQLALSFIRSEENWLYSLNSYFFFRKHENIAKTGQGIDGNKDL